MKLESVSDFIGMRTFQEMVTELEHFSYSIGHDMRAPLRAMKSFAALLEESEESAGHPENRNFAVEPRANSG